MTTLKTAVLPSTLALLLLIFGVVLALQGADEDSVRLLIRITAATSLLFFSLAFAASHSFHLVAIVALVQIAYDGDFYQLGDVANALDKGGLLYWAYSALCIGLLLLRITAFWNKRAPA